MWGSPPRDETTLVKFRQLLGEEGVEELLAQTINVAVKLKLIKPQELSRVIVDSTVQHKAIAHPTDSRLLETARVKLVEAAKDAGIDLKQTFAKEGHHLSRKAGRYAHARQFNRMIRWLLRMIARKGISFLRCVLLCLQQASCGSRSSLVFAMGRTTASDTAATLERRASHNLSRLPIYPVMAA